VTIHVASERPDMTTIEPPTPSTVADRDEADSAAGRATEIERQHQHEEAEIDEALEESFPASDPPSSWAGP
jgi:hypothetical protein